MPNLQKRRFRIGRYTNLASWICIVLGLILIFIAVPVWVWIATLGFGCLVVGLLIRQGRHFF